MSLPIMDPAGRPKSPPTPAAAHATITMAELAPHAFLTLSLAARQLLVCQSNQFFFRAPNVAMSSPGNSAARTMRMPSGAAQVSDTTTSFLNLRNRA